MRQNTVTKFSIPLYTLVVLTLAGCVERQVAPIATIPARQIETQKITLGASQMLKVGMAGSDVIDALSSPNIVTTDKDGLETWVYDKISNEYEYVSARDDGWFFSPRNQNSGVSTSTQKTLIVVIKFDGNKKIKSLQYRQTSY